MSYPEPRYLGDDGEASATVRSNDAPPDITYQSGGTADYLATGASTGGLFGLYRWNMSAEPSGPGPHYHRTMAESFYVLVGTVRIYDGREWVACRPGEESQQPTCPHVRHSRRCTQRPPPARHSAQPSGGRGLTSLTCSRWVQAGIRLLTRPRRRAAPARWRTG